MIWVTSPGTHFLIPDTPHWGGLEDDDTPTRDTLLLDNHQQNNVLRSTAWFNKHCEEHIQPIVPRSTRKLQGGISPQTRCPVPLPQQPPLLQNPDNPLQLGDAHTHVSTEVCAGSVRPHLGRALRSKKAEGGRRMRLNGDRHLLVSESRKQQSARRRERRVAVHIKVLREVLSGLRGSKGWGSHHPVLDVLRRALLSDGIRHLDLTGHVLTDQDCLALEAVLSTHPTLCHVVLAKTILPSSLEFLVRAVAANPRLEAVDLEGAIGAFPPADIDWVRTAVGANVNKARERNAEREARALARRLTREEENAQRDIADITTWEGTERKALVYNEETARAALQDHFTAESLDRLSGMERRGLELAKKGIMNRERELRGALLIKYTRGFIKVALQATQVLEEAWRNAVQHEEGDWRYELQSSEASSAKLTRLGYRDRERRERLARLHLIRDEAASRRGIAGEQLSEMIMLSTLYGNRLQRMGRNRRPSRWFKSTGFSKSRLTTKASALAVVLSEAAAREGCLTLPPEQPEL